MEKLKVITEIQAYFQEELKSLGGEAESSEKGLELKRMLTMYQFLPRREYDPDDVIIPSSLVELRLAETTAFYFIAPQGGGLVTRVEGKPVQIITPQSPLEEALLGKKRGDKVRVQIRDGFREYEIISAK